jgi:hypothetical protein
MSNNFSILNSYPKGNSNIRGEFLILNEDPSLCLVSTESGISDTFISEDGEPSIIPVTPEITPETEINIWFDDSGSMDATLFPLEVMRDTILKNALLPIYNNDESLYNNRVNILYMGSETIEGYSTFEGCILCAAKQKRDSSVTQVINLIFQDESSPYDAEGFFDPDYRTTDYEDHVNVLRNVIQTDSSVYSVIFQVEGYSGFKTFLQTTQNCLNAYQGIYGICDLPRLEIDYDVISGDAPSYYLNLIVNKLRELGFSNI